MRLIPRNRDNEQGKVPRIAISQAEITADLLYPAPATPRQAAREVAVTRRSAGR